MSEYMKEAFEAWFKSQIWGNEDFKACLSEAWQAALLAHTTCGALSDHDDMRASDYLKEAERLLDELCTCTLAEATHYASPDFKRAKASEEAANRARAALLAHIQRRGVPEGWKEATIAWEVCASIHREYAKKKDPFFTTRQADFVKHTEAARAAMLAAAPAPDHFRDAAEMVAVPADDHIASAIHYPECWDTAAYPTVESALSEVFAHYRCTEHDAPVPDQFRNAAKMMAVQPSCMTCSGHGMIGGLLPNGGGYESDPCPDCTAPAPAEVPMPEPVAYGFGNTAITGHTNRLMMVRIDIPLDDQYAGAFWLPLVLADEAHTYGVACRAAGEAAGYARGLKEADKLLQALRDIADPIAAYERDLPPGYTLDGAACVRMADNPETYRRMAREAIADLRGEVK